MSYSDNPIVLFIVVREAAHQTPAKMIEQSCSCVQRLLFRYFMLQVLSAKKQFQELHLVSDNDKDHVDLLLEWVEHSADKSIKIANEKEWEALKAEFGKSVFVAHDSKVDEDTVMCFWPVRESDTPKSVRKLHSLQ